MSSVVFVACTPVARYMMLEILTNPELSSVKIAGVVNLNSQQAVNKANYDSYGDLKLLYDLPVHYCNNINDEETLLWIREKSPDIIIQSGWSQKFGSALLSIPRYLCIGEHPAPLPKGRGAACVNWAILTGEKYWGDSFFEMVAKYDEGAVLAQKFFNIDFEDDVATVYDKVAGTSKEIVCENIMNWCTGKFNSIEQDTAKATYYKKRRPADGLFDFNMNSIELYNFIRAQAKPYPGAYFMHNNKKAAVWKAKLLDTSAVQKASVFLEPSSSKGVLAVTADGGIIELLRIQNENEPEQWGADWYRRNCAE